MEIQKPFWMEERFWIFALWPFLIVLSVDHLFLHDKVRTFFLLPQFSIFTERNPYLPIEIHCIWVFHFQGDEFLREYVFFLNHLVTLYMFFDSNSVPSLDNHESFWWKKYQAFFFWTQNIKLTLYSPCIMPDKTIWWAALFWWLHFRSWSAILLSVRTLSALRSSDHFQLLPTCWIAVVSMDQSVSNESITLEMSIEPHLRAVSFVRCVIWSCVSDIFHYNDVKIIQNYAKNQGDIRPYS